MQLARELGAARVLGTASQRNDEFLRGLGCEPVRYGDALTDNVAELVGGDGRVDAVLDCVGGPALDSSVDLVRDPARVVSIVDGERARKRGGQHVFVRPDRDQLGWLAGLVDAGRLRVEVQQVFPLAQAADAQRLLAGGHVRGKLVLAV